MGQRRGSTERLLGLSCLGCLNFSIQRLQKPKVAPTGATYFY